MKGNRETKTGIAIFASGTGSNAQKIIEYFNTSSLAAIRLIVSNNNKAAVLDKAVAAGIPTLLIKRDKFNADGYLDELKKYGIEFIVLAGFLWRVPKILIDAYPKHIINIHPALLPKYGGKGMYGQWVHESVIKASESETGITIHYVDEQYDNGDIIFQAVVPIDNEDTPDSVAEKVHRLEHQHFPMVIESVIRSTFQQQSI